MRSAHDGMDARVTAARASERAVSIGSARATSAAAPRQGVTYGYAPRGPSATPAPTALSSRPPSEGAHLAHARHNGPPAGASNVLTRSDEHVVRAAATISDLSEQPHSHPPQHSSGIRGFIESYPPLQEAAAELPQRQLISVQRARELMRRHADRLRNRRSTSTSGGGGRLPSGAAAGQQRPPSSAAAPDARSGSENGHRMEQRAVSRPPVASGASGGASSPASPSPPITAQSVGGRRPLDAAPYNPSAPVTLPGPAAPGAIAGSEDDAPCQTPAAGAEEDWDVGGTGQDWAAPQPAAPSSPPPAQQLQHQPPPPSSALPSVSGHLVAQFRRMALEAHGGSLSLREGGGGEPISPTDALMLFSSSASFSAVTAAAPPASAQAQWEARHPPLAAEAAASASLPNNWRGSSSGALAGAVSAPGSSSRSPPRTSMKGSRGGGGGTALHAGVSSPMVRFALTPMLQAPPPPHATAASRAAAVAIASLRESVDGNDELSETARGRVERSTTTPVPTSAAVSLSRPALPALPPPPPTEPEAVKRLAVMMSPGRARERGRQRGGGTGGGQGPLQPQLQQQLADGTVVHGGDGAADRLTASASATVLFESSVSGTPQPPAPQATPSAAEVLGELSHWLLPGAPPAPRSPAGLPAPSPAHSSLPAPSRTAVAAGGGRSGRDSGALVGLESVPIVAAPPPAPWPAAALAPVPRFSSMLDSIQAKFGGGSLLDALAAKAAKSAGAEGPGVLSSLLLSQAQVVGVAGSSSATTTPRAAHRHPVVFEETVDHVQATSAATLEPVASNGVARNPVAVATSSLIHSVGGPLHDGYTGFLPTAAHVPLRVEEPLPPRGQPPLHSSTVRAGQSHTEFLGTSHTEFLGTSHTEFLGTSHTEFLGEATASHPVAAVADVGVISAVADVGIAPVVAAVSIVPAAAASIQHFPGHPDSVSLAPLTHPAGAVLFPALPFPDSAATLALLASLPAAAPRPGDRVPEVVAPHSTAASPLPPAEEAVAPHRMALLTPAATAALAVGGATAPEPFARAPAPVATPPAQLPPPPTLAHAPVPALTSRVSTASSGWSSASSSASSAELFDRIVRRAVEAADASGHISPHLLQSPPALQRSSSPSKQRVQSSPRLEEQSRGAAVPATPERPIPPLHFGSGEQGARAGSVSASARESSAPGLNRSSGGGSGARPGSQAIVPLPRARSNSDGPSRAAASSGPAATNKRPARAPPSAPTSAGLDRHSAANGATVAPVAGIPTHVAPVAGIPTHATVAVNAVPASGADAAVAAAAAAARLAVPVTSQAGVDAIVAAVSPTPLLTPAPQAAPTVVAPATAAPSAAAPAAASLERTPESHSQPGGMLVPARRGSRPPPPAPAPPALAAVSLTNGQAGLVHLELKLAAPVAVMSTTTVAAREPAAATSPQPNRLVLVASPPPSAFPSPSQPLSPSKSTPQVIETLPNPKLHHPSTATTTTVITTYAGLCEQGWSPHDPDKPNQDCIIMEEDSGDGEDAPPRTEALLLAVFDGHGPEGHSVAQFFRDRLPARLFAHPSMLLPPPTLPPQPVGTANGGNAPTHPPSYSHRRVPTAPDGGPAGAALRQVLRDLESELLSPPASDAIDASLSGCTACVAVVQGSRVTLANIGDSRAALMSWTPGAQGGGAAGAPQPLHSLQLTQDHKPSLPGETRRILLAGGRLEALSYSDGTSGPVRVWLRNEDIPGLAMSRSLGDTIAKEAGVVSTPDVTVWELDAGAAPSHGDAFLVLASDGLWEFMACEDVAGILARSHPNGPTDEGDEAAAAAALEAALGALADEASERWTVREGAIDDLSIVVARVGAVGAQA